MPQPELVYMDPARLDQMFTKSVQRFKMSEHTPVDEDIDWDMDRSASLHRYIAKATTPQRLYEATHCTSVLWD